MANCKICGKPVVAALVFHPACRQTQVEEVVEAFCDNYCRFLREAANEEVLQEQHCDSCPMARMLNLGV